MSPHSTLLIEAFPAHTAAVRFLPSVGALVGSEVPLHIELFPAHITGMRFLTAVDAEVAGVMRFVISGVLTLVTLVPLLPRPPQFWVTLLSVSLHERLIGETNAANVAGKT